MAISPTSASYPILGAARASGVGYPLALELAFCVAHPVDDTRLANVRLAIIGAHGAARHIDLYARLRDAKDQGRLWLGGVA